MDAAHPLRVSGFGLKGEEQGHEERNTRQGVQRTMDFVSMRGRTGFDGDVEVGIAGGGAWPP